ncbi:MAG: LamG-like jellyroll fold domain-containing protein [Casimicrobiaceae bacterium]
MALIIRPQWMQQPQGAVELDSGNPLAQRITHCIPFNGSWSEIISRAPLTLGAAGSGFVDARGRSLLSSGISGGAATVPLVLQGVEKMSLSFSVYWDTNANNDKIAMEYSPTINLNQGFFVDINSSVGGVVRAAASGVTSNSCGKTFTRPTAAAWHHYAVLFDMSLSGAVSSAYVDGVSQALTVSGGSIPGTMSNNATLYIFSRNTTSLLGSGRMQNLLIRVNYLMSEVEVRQEYQNPWQIYRPPPRRWVPGAGVTFQPAWARRANTILGAGAPL